MGLPRPLGEVLSSPDDSIPLPGVGLVGLSEL